MLVSFKQVLLCFERCRRLGQLGSGPVVTFTSLVSSMDSVRLQLNLSSLAASGGSVCAIWRLTQNSPITGLG
jgi:hypothetical protein